MNDYFNGVKSNSLCYELEQQIFSEAYQTYGLVRTHSFKSVLGAIKDGFSNGYKPKLSRKILELRIEDLKNIKSPDVFPEIWV